MRENLLELAGVKEFLDLVAECMDRAWSRLRDDTAPHNWADLTSRSRSSNLHDYIMAELRIASMDIPDVEVNEDRQLRYIITPFAEMRLKKFGQKFQSLSLNNTNRTQQWVNLRLPGELAALDKLFIGYTVGRSWSIPQELGLAEVVGKSPVDLLIIPFEDQIPDTGLVPDQLTPRLRLNYAAAKRERQAALPWSSDGDTETTGT